MIRLYYYQAGKGCKSFTIGFNVYGLDSYFEDYIPNCYWQVMETDGKAWLDTKITNKILHLLNIPLDTLGTKHEFMYFVPEKNLDASLEVEIKYDGRMIYGIGVTDYDTSSPKPRPDHIYTVKTYGHILYTHI